MSMSTKGKTSTYDVLSESEDEFDWEEVTVPQAQHIELEELEDQAGPSTRPNIEVTLEAYPTRRKGDARYVGFLDLTGERFKARYRKKSSGGISHAERLLRIDCHKLHTVTLISNAAVRNRWINDELLQVRKTPSLAPEA
jgi:xeroderma pigmentosum group C-complementing protein